jgi:HPr kinase/phosphorylase
MPGTLLRIDGQGILLTGESGSGKSDAALGLLDRGHALVADDAVELELHLGRPRGRCPAPLQGLLAVRGLGVLEVGALFGAAALCPACPIDLIVHLDAAQPLPVDPLAVQWATGTIMAANIPKLTLPTRGGRDLPLLIELAVRSGRQRAQAALVAGHQALPRESS